MTHEVCLSTEVGRLRKKRASAHSRKCRGEGMAMVKPCRSELTTG